MAQDLIVSSLIFGLLSIGRAPQGVDLPAGSFCVIPIDASFLRCQAESCPRFVSKAKSMKHVGIFG